MQRQVDDNRSEVNSATRDLRAKIDALSARLVAMWTAISRILGAVSQSRAVQPGEGRP